jgi:Protein of unknown function (DUF3148)
MKKEFSVGDRVRVIALPEYIKTAEPIPMLRPASLIQVGEEGIILNQQPGDFWSVRLERGAYLLDSQYLELVSLTNS